MRKVFPSPSSSSPSSSTPAATVEAPDEQRRRDEPAPRGRGMTYKTKVIQFLGRTTPIVLQNTNGPCPLLAICNILLLKNCLQLNPDVPEVSQEKLLSLVAERLIDSITNVNDEDTGYVNNPQQNISDAIDLLPRLTTGIDVNIKFERIGDFEFTRECAIFNMLDIPLYHGWIVDPKDHDTAKAIGSKTYNTLMGELVALETRDMGSEHKKNAEDDGVDCVAATTAALGVPDSSVSISDKHKAGKGDLEEEEDLRRALALSMGEGPISSVDDLLTNVQNSPNVVANIKDHERLVSDKASEINVAKDSSQPEAPISNVVTVSDDFVLNPNSCESESAGVAASSSPRIGHDPSKDTQEPNLLVENIDQSEDIPSSAGGSHVRIVGDNIDIKDSDLSSGRRQDSDDPETFTSSGDSRHVHNESPKDGISAREGELIRNFFKDSASQLTIYGLFCLQAGLKERELCVFFRNNHFNTMFKFESELYILATDQGFLNEPNMVWEKLNGVTGDTNFVTSNFKEFNNPGDEYTADFKDFTIPWDDDTDEASSADFLESLGNAVRHKYFDPDMQLEISLQQQDSNRNQAQPTGDDVPRLKIIGPRRQVSRHNSNRSTSSSKKESKPAKEKCTVM
ncbi:PREDICTED: ubiquitin carboxyl-terminal hydrolase MINDY-1-like [Ipomoea nil]|uniref:ubiquitin carboxyl-terminal hydrolase MINDY-1-like n=1 Tax=Ipomoea nil TaxID=35883 RepID=UPI0009019DB3|nr:PREDICTED: ubiquitin carboxyl-terminal hydrolase MINDY-1-like [Ipomoea nil]